MGGENREGAACPQRAGRAAAPRVRRAGALRRSLALAALAALALAPAAHAGSETAPLFRIERSKNANVVQYDARLSPDGRLDAREPVVAYWLRLAGDGRRESLSWIQRKFAYGFDARLAAQRAEAVLEMAAPIGRPLRVREVAGAWRAETRIAERPALIERVYVRSDDDGGWPRVLYVDLHGIDAESGAPVFERVVPAEGGRRASGP
jgi:hypothetical protein